MENFVKDLAAREGWTDATTVAVLAGVLQQLVDMGSADPADLQALIRTRGGVDGQEPPEFGDEVEMKGVDTVIEIAEVPDDQPEAGEGIYSIVDQYGETHRVEWEDGRWMVVIPAI